MRSNSQRRHRRLAVKQQIVALEQALQQAQQLLHQDDLTPLLNRRGFRRACDQRADGGVNLLGYAWKQDGRPDSRIHGVVIVDPRRFVHPVPPINPALARVAQVEADPDR